MTRCIREWIPSPAHYLPVILSVLYAIGAPAPAKSYDFEDCEGCHDSILGEDAGREYLHDPFEQKQCEYCHAVQETDESTANERKDQLKINWLGETATPSSQHSFLLPGKKVREVLVVDVSGKAGEFSRHEINVPLLADLAEVKDIGQAPAISGLHVQKAPGVLLSAIIGWQTDAVTDAMVRYGEGELNQSSAPSLRLGLEHQVVLRNLRANKTYRLIAVSRDLFGRTQESSPVTFSTADIVAAAPSSSISPPENNAGFVYDFKRLNDDYLLELTFNQPAMAYVGVRGQARSQGGMPVDEIHDGLSSQVMMSMKACLNCHKAHLHPLNVIPTKPGITIPREFPTLSDGRITCSSCHEPHGSDFYFHLRKPEQQLCASCHPKWEKSAQKESQGGAAGRRR